MGNERWNPRSVGCMVEFQRVSNVPKEPLMVDGIPETSSGTKLKSEPELWHEDPKGKGNFVLL